LREERADCLIQGTIAADVSETVRGIKTQHNVLEQISVDYGIRVIEPLREIYKPQVREVARAFSLPLQVSERRPFPGPGLATRVLGEVTPEKVDIVRKATRIVESEAEGIEHFQSLAVLLSDKATGIREGKRAYGDIVVVRVVKSEDAMRAEATKVPWQTLRRIGQRIVSEIPKVVHVLYSITDKPPATIEFQ
jgi:GMP synthase (glutamine-hydrolysing)